VSVLAEQHLLRLTAREREYERKSAVDSIVEGD
jgi:hypothetical protein